MYSTVLMACRDEQLSMVEKIVGDKDDDYDDSKDFEGDELQPSNEVSVIGSSTISNNNQHVTEYHGNDELVAPVIDPSLNTRTLLDCLHQPTASKLARK